MLTVKEVAERLAISRSLAYRMIRTGEIPSYRIANCRRVSEDDFKAYMERAKHENEKLVSIPATVKKHF